MNPNLQVFIQNQRFSVCLPLVSDCQRFVWVYSNQVDIPPKSAIELSKVFDRYPYLTQKETNRLAQRCSLHPDQVKVWFMVERIRYGISWDFKDIFAARSKLKSNQGEKERKAGGGQKKGCKKKTGVSGGTQAKKECKKEKTANKGGKEEKKVNQEQPMEEEKNEKEDNENTEEKQVTEPEEERAQEEGRTEMQMLLQLTDTEMEKKRHAVSLNPAAVTDVLKLKEIIEGPDDPTTDSEEESPLKPRCPQKTEAQVLMMRTAFLQCQYPDHEDYNQLSEVIGLHRSVLVQWYNDTRYHIKRAMPRWLSPEQHKRMLANIKYRQFLKSVMKLQPAKREKRIQWKKALVGIASQ